MTDDRAERKRLLRRKIAAQRAERTGVGGCATSVCERIRNDPTSALMSMGIDDASVLQSVAKINTQNTETLRHSVTSMKRQQKTIASQKKTPVNTLSPVGATTSGVGDDEEEPPPVLATIGQTSLVTPSTSAVFDGGHYSDDEEAPPA